jgi:hypothetical protein
VRDVGIVLRGVVAMLFAAAGLLHVDAAIGHEGEPVLQAGFAVVAALQVGVAGLMLVGRRPLRPVLVGGMALQAGSIAAWLLSRTSGLPEWVSPGGHVEPIGVADGVCVALEIASLPACVLLLSAAVRTLPSHSPRHALVVAGTLVAALLVPALVVTEAAPLRLDGDLLASAPARHGHEVSREHDAGRAHRRPEHRAAGHRRAASHRGHRSSTAASGHTSHTSATTARHAVHAALPAGTHPASHTGSAPHRDHSEGTGGNGRTHHHHGSSSPKPPAPQQSAPPPSSPPANAASAPPAPPPDPCSSGTTVADVGETEVVYAPGQGTGVHVC